MKIDKESTVPVFGWMGLVSFVVAAFAIHFVAGMATLGLAFLIVEWRMDREQSSR